MRARVKSGIDVIDRAIGGLRRDETYLLVGETGTGKTIMAQHFVLEGIRKGEHCLWITDEKPRDLLFQADSLDMDLTGAVRDGKLRFLQRADDYATIVDRNTDVLSLVDELKSHIDELKATRIVIDRIGSLLDLNQSPQFTQGFAGSLLNFLCDLPCTTLLVDSSSDGDGFEWQKKLLERVSFGIFQLGWDELRSTRYLTIKKMRGTPFDPSPRKFSIVNGQGIRGAHESEDSGREAASSHLPGRTKSIWTVRLDPEYKSALMDTLGPSWQILDAGEKELQSERVGSSALIVIETRGERDSMIDQIRRLREDGYDLPVLLMTSGSSRVTDRIRALRSGVDEYVEGALRTDEFTARVGSLLRRSGHDMFTTGEDQERVADATADTEGSEEDDRYRDGPSMAYDVKSGHFSLSVEQSRKILENMKHVGGLGVHFSLVCMRFQSGSETEAYAVDSSKELMEKALKAVVSQCRDEDIMVRARGEEIIIILVGADSKGTKKFFARVEKSLKDLLGVDGYALNYSFGSASYPEDTETYHDIIDRALKTLGSSAKMKIA